jgi:hypothetical protein
VAIVISLPSESAEAAVSSTSTQFATTMIVGTYYELVANVGLWLAQGSDPTASAGSDSMYVPAGVVVILDPSNGVKAAVIEDSAAGKASLTATSRF